MEILYFTTIAVGLYAISDAALNYVERSRGARFEHRQLIFFCIILVLALVTFQALEIGMRAAG